MPQLLLDHFDVSVGEQGQRGGEVPQIVKADRRQAGQLHQACEASGYPVGVQLAAVLVRPYASGLDIGVAPLPPLPPSFDSIWLRATAFEDAVCRIEVTDQARKDGVRRPAKPLRSVALVGGNSLAYLILSIDQDETDPARQVHLGAAGYRPDGATLA